MTDKKKALVALKKAYTLLGKTLNMAEVDDYCMEVIQQGLAVIGLIKSAHLQLLEGHLQCCYKDAMMSGDEEKIEQMTKEILMVVRTAQNK